MCRHFRLRRVLRLAIVTAVVFALAFSGGAYSVSDRALIGITTAWIVGACAAAGGLRGSPVATVAACSSFAGFAVVTLASIAWGTNNELAVLEFNRAAMYVGIFAVAALAADRWGRGLILDGLTLGISGVVLLALGSRTLPKVFPAGHLATYLPAAGARLSYPVNYWNGLGMLAALALPGLLTHAAAPNRGWPRAMALTPVPAIAAVIYLTSSRGAVLVAAIACLLTCAFAGNRVMTLASLAVSLLGAAAVVRFLRTHPTIADGPLNSGAAHRQAHLLLALILAVAVASACLNWGAARLFGNVRCSRLFGLALVAGGLISAVALVLASHPVRQFQAFKQPASATVASHPDEATVSGHILSASGSGRWQLWGSAVDEYRAHPVTGGGAGSFGAWWLQHGSLPVFVRNAHSLWLEALAEIGPLGLLFLVGAFGAALVPVFARREPEAGGLAAVGLAFAVGVSIDWIWEIAAIGVVGVAALAAVSTAGARRCHLSRRSSRMVAAAAAVVLLSQTDMFVADMYLRQSQAAAADGELAAAVAAATRARRLEPWASSPYLQRALVREQQGDLLAAREDVRKATSRAPQEWTSWLIRARIELELTHVVAARQSLERARVLNPRSQFFRNP